MVVQMVEHLEPLTAGGPAFARGLARHADRIALIDADGQELSYGALAARADEVRAELGPTRRLVVVEAAPEPGAVIAYLGALRAGSAVLLVPPDRPAQVDALVDRYQPDAVLQRHTGWTVRSTEPGTRTSPHPDLTLLLSTSGSTGSPKLVRLSQANVDANAAAISEVLGVSAGDRAITTLPWHYCYGLSILHTHLLQGGAVILTPASVLDGCFWRAFRRHGATSLSGVPHTFDLLERAGFGSMQLPTLRTVTQAGGRLAPERVRALAELGRRRGWALHVMYGQTEATARMAVLPPDLAGRHPHSIGRAIPGGTFEIEPVADRPAGVGQLVYRGPNVMMGYAEGPADLARGRDVDRLATGDLAREIDGGLYEIVGRMSRFTKVFGIRTDLDRLAELVRAAHGPALVAGHDELIAVAVDERQDRAAVAALVRSHSGLPATAIEVVTPATLPRLDNGKPDHAAVVELAEVQRARQRDAPGCSPAEAEGVRALYRDLFGGIEVGDDDTFAGLGGDSLSYVEASVRLEALLGRLPPQWPTTSVAELARGRVARRGRLRLLETSVVLRALCITLIVGSHSRLFHLEGGAHVLLAVAGYGFARFRVGSHHGGSPPGAAAGDRSTAARRTQFQGALRSIGRLALPCIGWLALVQACTGELVPANLVLLNTYLGPQALGVPWRYWFLEALVVISVAAALLTAIPPVARLERRHPFGFGLALVGLALVLRDDPLHLLRDDLAMYRPHTVAWFFALGWCAQRSVTTVQRLVVSVLVVGIVPGFFDRALRDQIVMAGLLALLWCRALPVTVGLQRIVVALAASSLPVYLLHWHLQPSLRTHFGPWAAMVVPLVVGVALGLVQTSTGQRLALARAWVAGRPIRRALAPAAGLVRSSGRAAGRRTARGAVPG